MKYLPLALLIAIAVCSCSKPEPEPLPVPESVTAPPVQSRGAIPDEKPQKAASIHLLQIGMPSDSVKALLGEPSRINTISRKPERMEWWYGDDQKVEIKKGHVDRLVIDNAKEQQMLKQLMEAGQKNNDAEVNRLMEELTK